MAGSHSSWPLQTGRGVIPRPKNLGLCPESTHSPRRSHRPRSDGLVFTACLLGKVTGFRWRFRAISAKGTPFASFAFVAGMVCLAVGFLAAESWLAQPELVPCLLLDFSDLPH